MLAEFFEVLARIRSLQKGEQWKEANRLANEEFRRILGLEASELARLTEVELLARLIRSESTLAVREKTLMVASLLKESGEIAAALGKEEESKLYHLKGLQLLLRVLTHEDVSDCPQLVPRVDCFLAALPPEELPLGIAALLMHHYERIGEFGKAEDTLFSMLEKAPQNSDLFDLGLRFYQRLEEQSDDALMLGNLPRAELHAGLHELKSSANSFSSSAPGT